MLAGYEGKLMSICEKYCYSESARRLGHKNFDRNTSYILTGWSAKGDTDNNPDGGLCILVSTMNLVLNHVRANLGSHFQGDPVYLCPFPTPCLSLTVMMLGADGQEWTPPYLHQYYHSRPGPQGAHRCSTPSHLLRWVDRDMVKSKRRFMRRLRKRKECFSFSV